MNFHSSASTGVMDKRLPRASKIVDAELVGFGFHQPVAHWEELYKPANKNRRPDCLRFGLRLMRYWIPRKCRQTRILRTCSPEWSHSGRRRYIRTRTGRRDAHNSSAMVRNLSTYIGSRNIWPKRASQGNSLQSGPPGRWSRTGNPAATTPDRASTALNSFYALIQRCQSRCRS